MKAGILLGLAFFISSAMQAQETKSVEADSKAAVRGRYLGVAGWEITDGKTTILIDPYISRLPGPPADGNEPGPGWPGKLHQSDLAVPDTAAIDRHIDRADFILMTHAHYVHLLDAPYIARTRKAVLIGNESMANIARAYDVPDDQIVTVLGGEDFDFGTFSVRVIPSLHSQGAGKHYFNGGAAPKGAKAPLPFKDYVDGGTFGFLIRFNGVQILAFGSMNFIENQVTGLRPDVLLMPAAAQRKEIYDYSGRLLRATGMPPLVVATHWDFSQLPYGANLDREVKNAEEFASEVKAASPKTQVIIPKHFEWNAFPAKAAQ
jgi:L-ascorbate metabolism protein UlaG (beta-lactamase superfamily)